MQSALHGGFSAFCISDHVFAIERQFADLQKRF